MFTVTLHYRSERGLSNLNGFCKVTHILCNSLIKLGYFWKYIGGWEINSNLPCFFSHHAFSFCCKPRRLLFLKANTGNGTQLL